MESKFGGIEEKLKGNVEDMKNGLKVDMEGLKGGLKKLLEEMIPNGKKVVDETHDENTRNVTHDFIDSNVGLNNHHIPKIDRRKFDDKDPVTWKLQMEQYFDLHNVKNTKKYALQLYI